MKINNDKLSKIKKEQILNPERFAGSKKMTLEILENALSDALKKIDRLWNDVHGNFASHASLNGIYQEEMNDEYAGWNNGFWTGMLWLA